MCGIAGIFLFNKNLQEQLRLIVGMTDALHHRGPDDNGYFTNDRVALGHKRLSIIDLSSNAKQPITNEDNTLALVFNGEIYNFREIRKSLLAKGHLFKSESDGEVILHLYEEYGVECTKHLEGMFAFAVYDQRKETLYLARDRVGEKPLYYIKDHNGFLFSSEIKSFYGLDNFSGKISPAGMHAYFNYIQIPAPQTIFDGVIKLRPAHWLLIKPDGTENSAPYWQVDSTNKTQVSIHQAKLQLKQLMLDSVKKTLVSDAPVGILLSGGVDSSLVLALSQELGAQNITTFTAGHNSSDPRNTEYIRARITAARFHVKNYAYDFHDSDFSEIVTAVKISDEPIGHLGIFHMFNIFKDIKRHVKVILTGNGADEIFAGYSTYGRVTRIANWTKIFRWVIRKNNPLFNSYAASFSSFRKWKTLKNLFSNEIKKQRSISNYENLLSDAMRTVSYDNVLDAKLFMDLFVLLNHGLSSIPDFGSMAHSIELRSPFLHHKVIEFAATLPIDFKVKDQNNPFTNKLLLKNLACDYFKEEDIFCAKLGYGECADPLYLARTKWKNDVESLIFDPLVHETGFFDIDHVKHLWISLLSNQIGFDEKLIFSKYIIFCAWYKFNFLTSKRSLKTSKIET